MQSCAHGRCCISDRQGSAIAITHRQCDILCCRSIGRGGIGVGRRRGGRGRGKVGDAGVADGDGRARMLECVLGVVQEMQCQRQLVVRLCDTPVVCLSNANGQQISDARGKRW